MTGLVKLQKIRLCRNLMDDPTNRLSILTYNEMNKKQKTETASEICMCEVMLDDQLSDVDSEECDCQDCLRAMAQAYNQYLKESIVTTDESIRNTTEIKRNGHKHSKSTRKHSYSRQPCRRCTKWDHNEQPDMSLNEFQLRELMMRVNSRIQSNLMKHRALQADQTQQKLELMKKVKEQLKKLSYRCRIELQKAGKKPVKLEQLKVWNYQPLGARQKSQKCFEDRHRDKLKAPTYTGAVNLDTLNKMNFINQIKRRVKEQYKRKKQKIHKCEYDDCDRHHMNTPAQDIAKSIAKTEERAKKYLEKLQKLKKDKQNLDKLKEAKLRGLALQAKKRLDRSKKYSLSTERTTFNLEIEQFSTFSHLRQHYEQENKQKEMEKQFNKPTKKKQQKIENSENEQVNIQKEEKKVEKQQKPPKQQTQREPTEQERQQNLKKVKKSLKDDPIKIKPSGNMQSVRMDQDPQLMKSQRPIDQKNLRNIFKQAKMLMPPAQVMEQQPKKTIQKKTSTQDFQKQKFQKQRIEKKKKEIQKNLQKNKQELIESYQNRKTKAYGQILNPPAEKLQRRQSNQQIKQAFMKKLREKEEPTKHYIHQPTPAQIKSKNKHFQQNYNYYSKVEDSNQLARAKIAVSDPILDKRQHNHNQHDPSHILLDNDFLSDEDKKVFILNYRLLSKAEQLRI